VVAGILFTVWLVAELWLKKRSAGWLLPSGQTAQVRALGAKPRLAVVGALILLGWSRVQFLPDSVKSAPPPSVASPSPLSDRDSPAAQPTRLLPPALPRTREVPSPLPAVRILDFLLEARLTCDLNSTAELPPGEVEFLPIGGGSDAKLHGPAGDELLRFVSPVRFREHAGSVTVINRFALPPGSDLHGRPSAALEGFHEVQVPIVTVVYGTACSRMRLLEVSARLNGEDQWYEQWKYDAPFQQGPVFTVPLGQLHARLRAAR
jgi:hypothetical protein